MRAGWTRTLAGVGRAGTSSSSCTTGARERSRLTGTSSAARSPRCWRRRSPVQSLRWSPAPALRRDLQARRRESRLGNDWFKNMVLVDMHNLYPGSIVIISIYLTINVTACGMATAICFFYLALRARRGRPGPRGLAPRSCSTQTTVLTIQSLHLKNGKRRLPTPRQPGQKNIPHVFNQRILSIPEKKSSYNDRVTS